MASSQAMGRAEPGAIQVVKLVGPMWVRSFPITARCGIVRTKAFNASLSVQAESVQNVLRIGWASRR